MRRRGRMLTDGEIALLIVAAAIGLVAVVGTYWYASTIPLPTHAATLDKGGR